MLQQKDSQQQQQQPAVCWDWKVTANIVCCRSLHIGYGRHEDEGSPVSCFLSFQQQKGIWDTCGRICLNQESTTHNSHSRTPVSPESMAVRHQPGRPPKSVSAGIGYHHSIRALYLSPRANTLRAYRWKGCQGSCVSPPCESTSHHMSRASSSSLRRGYCFGGS